MEEPRSAQLAEKNATGTAPGEAARLRATRALKAFEGPRDEPRFLRITRLAARLFGAPRARLFLIDAATLKPKACFGCPLEEAPRAKSLANLAIAQREPIICENARTDARLSALAPVNFGFLACAPVIDPAGEVVGLLCVESTAAGPPVCPEDLQTLKDLAALAMEELLRDVPDARRDASGRSLDSERLALAIGAASLGEFEWDRTLKIYRISPRLAAIANLPEGVIPDEDGQALFVYVHPDDRAEIQRTVDEQLRKRGRYEVEFRRNPDDKGRVQWNRAAGVMTLDEAGEPTRLIGVIQDITGRKQQNEQRESLLAELDHRIKNLLAVVQSVAAQSARKSSSLDVFLKTFAGRLKSMSSAHDLLSAARWRGATLARIAAAELRRPGPDPDPLGWSRTFLDAPRGRPRPCR